MTLHDLTRGLVLVAFCQCGHKADVSLQALATAKSWEKLGHHSHQALPAVLTLRVTAGADQYRVRWRD